jgi:hypothetical protein
MDGDRCRASEIETLGEGSVVPLDGSVSKEHFAQTIFRIMTAVLLKSQSDEL